MPRKRKRRGTNRRADEASPPPSPRKRRRSKKPRPLVDYRHRLARLGGAISIDSQRQRRARLRKQQLRRRVRAVAATRQAAAKAAGWSLGGDAAVGTGAGGAEGAGGDDYIVAERYAFAKLVGVGCEGPADAAGALDRPLSNKPRVPPWEFYLLAPVLVLGRSSRARRRVQQRWWSRRHAQGELRGKIELTGSGVAQEHALITWDDHRSSYTVHCLQLQITVDGNDVGKGESATLAHGSLLSVGTQWMRFVLPQGIREAAWNGGQLHGVGNVPTASRSGRSKRRVTGAKAVGERVVIAAIVLPDIFRMEHEGDPLPRPGALGTLVRSRGAGWYNLYLHKTERVVRCKRNCFLTMWSEGDSQAVWPTSLRGLQPALQPIALFLRQMWRRYHANTSALGGVAGVDRGGRDHVQAPIPNRGLLGATSGATTGGGRLQVPKHGSQDFMDWPREAPRAAPRTQNLQFAPDGERGVWLDAPGAMPYGRGMRDLRQIPDRMHYGYATGSKCMSVGGGLRPALSHRRCCAMCARARVCIFRPPCALRVATIRHHAHSLRIHAHPWPCPRLQCTLRPTATTSAMPTNPGRDDYGQDDMEMVAGGFTQSVLGGAGGPHALALSHDAPRSDAMELMMLRQIQIVQRRPRDKRRPGDRPEGGGCRVEHAAVRTPEVCGAHAAQR